MPHDPARIAEVRGWIGRALEDLRAATHELTAVPPLLGDIVVHCQQAVDTRIRHSMVRPATSSYSISALKTASAGSL